MSAITHAGIICAAALFILVNVLLAVLMAKFMYTIIKGGDAE